MQVPGDPGPLVETDFHALLESPAYPADSEADQNQHGGRTTSHTQSDEPSGLNERRWDHESKRGARLVPHAIIVGGNHAEDIVIWS